MQTKYDKRSSLVKYQNQLNNMKWVHGQFPTGLVVGGDGCRSLVKLLCYFKHAVMYNMWAERWSRCCYHWSGTGTVLAHVHGIMALCQYIHRNNNAGVVRIFFIKTLGTLCNHFFRFWISYCLASVCFCWDRDALGFFFVTLATLRVCTPDVYGHRPV